MNIDFNFVSQSSHIGWGYLVTTALVLLFHWPIWVVALSLILIAGAKEYWDCHGLETPDVAGNSWIDWMFYCIGILFGSLVLLVR